MPAETIAKLKTMGHNVKIVSDGIEFGGYEAIIRDRETGVYRAATEMRKDGIVVGY